MKNETYNGWSNYATWKINLEFGFNDNPENYEHIGNEIEIMEYIKQEVEETIELGATEGSCALCYALDFISDVNWYEIAEHITKNIKENEEG
jgi:hypothetical protein